MRRYFSILILFTLLSYPALAQAQVCRIVPFNSGTHAIVAKPGKAKEMLSLIQGGEKMQAMLCCLACMPRVGAKVLITDHGMMSHSIRILDTPDAGCQGDVAVEYVGQCQ